MLSVICPATKVWFLAQIRRHGGGRHPCPVGHPGKAVLFLGGILQEATPEQRTEFIRALPAPIRLAWRLTGERIYQRGIRRVRGTR